MSVIYLYDSITQSNIPSTAQIVGAYTDGAYANVAAAKQYHPDAFIVPITVFGSHDQGALVIDCESGDATPAGAAEWANVERQAGRYPTIYTGEANIQNVSNALIQYNLHFSTDPTDTKGVYLWAAGYTGSPYLYPGSVATQWTDAGPYDISAVNDIWPYHLIGPLPQPTPPPPPINNSSEDVSMVILHDNTNQWLVFETGKVHIPEPSDGSALVNAGVKYIQVSTALLNEIPELT